MTEADACMLVLNLGLILNAMAWAAQWGREHAEQKDHKNEENIRSCKTEQCSVGLRHDPR